MQDLAGVTDAAQLEGTARLNAFELEQNLQPRAQGEFRRADGGRIHMQSHVG
ncbi:hypothetical protein D3C85_1492450 [compost metagenome]